MGGAPWHVWYRRNTIASEFRNHSTDYTLGLLFQVFYDADSVARTISPHLRRRMYSQQPEALHANGAAIKELLTKKFDAGIFADLHPIDDIMLHCGFVHNSQQKLSSCIEQLRGLDVDHELSEDSLDMRILKTEPAVYTELIDALELGIRYRHEIIKPIAKYFDVREKSLSQALYIAAKVTSVAYKKGIMGKWLLKSGYLCKPGRFSRILGRLASSSSWNRIKKKLVSYSMQQVENVPMECIPESAYMLFDKVSDIAAGYDPVKGDDILHKTYSILAEDVERQLYIRPERNAKL